MTLYRITGVTHAGEKISFEVNENNPRDALRRCKEKFGELRKGYEILKISKIDSDIKFIEQRKKGVIELSEKEREVIELSLKLKQKENPAATEDYKSLRIILSPMLDKLISQNWNGQVILTREDLKDRLLSYVIDEFIPNFDKRKGKLFAYLNMAISNRIKKIWSRETYVNPENILRKHPKIEDLKSIAYISNTPHIEYDSIEIIEKVIKKIEIGKTKLSLSQKRDLFSILVKEGIHKEILTSTKQILIIEYYYGELQLREKEIAEKNGITQQTVHKIKKSAERNLIKKIKNNL